MSKDTYTIGDFPFQELARFDTEAEAVAAGVALEHLWSVVEDGDQSDVWIYGPSCHYVNLLYLVQTKERHDGRTYWEEHLDGMGLDLPLGKFECLEQ
tara:strand:- start:1334 stop:1624 length:291 start_codon:yes stop_codon:yes gene_type:complete